MLAAAGIASRRAAEQLMLAGRVWVDGAPATTLGMRVNPARARIEVDGRRIAVDPEREYFLLNKPEGYVTTARDPQGRPTVTELVRARGRLFPVGRLDADTQGLLILTNDGELAHRLAHPRYQVPRTYLAEVRGEVPGSPFNRLVEGVRLEDGPARAQSARVVDRARGRSHVELVMTEGRKREVRRMLEAVGFTVLKLVRTRLGPLRIRGMGVGQVRPLTATEVGELYRSVGL